jgi:hypothetical protein
MYVRFTLVDRDSFIQLKNKTKIVTPLMALSLVLAIIITGTTILVPFQALNAQNATVQLENATESEQVGSSVIETLAQPGFGNKYDVTYKGTTVPISYNIIGGTVVGMLGDPQRHALYAVVEPGSDGGALEINLPRNALDAKSDTGTDISYIVKIDGQRISGEPSGICVGTCPNIFNSFKATGNTSTDRVLTIVFGPESRFIEIIGNSGI